MITNLLSDSDKFVILTTFSMDEIVGRFKPCVSLKNIDYDNFKIINFTAGWQNEVLGNEIHVTRTDNKLIFQFNNLGQKIVILIPVAAFVGVILYLNLNQIIGLQVNLILSLFPITILSVGLGLIENNLKRRKRQFEKLLSN